MKRLFLSVAVLCLLLTGCSARPYDEPAGPPKQEAWQIPADSFYTDSMDLEPFDTIQVDVMSGNVHLVTGETWSLSYTLPCREPLDTAAVTDGTLTFKTTVDPDLWLQPRTDRIVTITVPADAAFSQITVNAVTGNIEIGAVSCDSIVLFSNSGSITGQEMTAETLEANSFGDFVTITDADINVANIDSISGNLEVSGSFGELRTNTISGQTAVAADISVCGELDGASGPIRVDLRRPSAIDAYSSGKITLNGQVVDGPVTCGEGVPVSVQALSGNLKIYAP